MSESNANLLLLREAIRDEKPLRVIKEIVKTCPEAVQWQDDDGGLLLHYALELGMSPDSDCFRNFSELITFLVQQYPDSVRTKTMSGNLPIHVADRIYITKANGKVIRFLVEQFPECLLEKNHNGNLAIHTYLSFELSKEKHFSVLRWMVEMCPQIVRERNKDGNLLLHQAIMVDAPLTFVRFLLEVSPESALEKDKDGFCPLHLATTVEMVQCLIQSNSAVLRIQDQEGMLPLHHAVLQGDLFIKAIRLIVKHFPEGAKQKDAAGNLPLHVTLKNSFYVNDYDFFDASVAIRTVRLLIKHFPEAVRERSSKGHLPLHMALRKVGMTNGMDIFHLLMDLFPESGRIKDGKDNFPIHLAVRNYGLPVPVRTFVQMYPQALRERNAKGFLPLHLAVLHNDGNGIVPLLVENFPDSVKEKDSEGNLALHLASRMVGLTGDDKTVRYLIQMDPNGLHERNKNGLLPVMCVASDFKPSLKVIYFMIQQNPSFIWSPA